MEILKNNPKLHKTLKISPKWRILAKSGHIVDDMQRRLQPTCLSSNESSCETQKYRFSFINHKCNFFDDLRRQFRERILGYRNNAEIKHSDWLKIAMGLVIANQSA